MSKHIARIIVISLLLILVALPAFSVDNWMSTTFQYEHVFNTTLRADHQSDSIGFDVAWHSFLDDSFAGLFARSGFLFSIDNPTGTDHMLMRINMLMGPAFKVDINRTLTWYIGFGPFFSVATEMGVSKPSDETMFGVGVDTGLRINLISSESSGFYLVTGATGSVNFLHFSDDTASNRITGQVLPYVGFCFAFTPGAYNGYYVYNPLLW